MVPITSNADRVYPFQVLLSPGPSGLTVESKAQTEQVRSIAVQRFMHRIGRVSSAELAAIDDALRLHLDL